MSCWIVFSISLGCSCLHYFFGIFVPLVHPFMHSIVREVIGSCFILTVPSGKHHFLWIEMERSLAIFIWSAVTHDNQRLDFVFMWQHVDGNYMRYTLKLRCMWHMWSRRLQIRIFSRGSHCVKVRVLNSCYFLHLLQVCLKRIGKKSTGTP